MQAFHSLYSDRRKANHGRQCRTARGPTAGSSGAIHEKRRKEPRHMDSGKKDGFCRSIAGDVKLGEDVKIYNFVNLYGCEIGDRTKIGAFVEIQKGAKVGADCKISSHTFICEGVTLEDGVFVGHHVVFINDRHPRATNRNGELQTEADWTVQPTLIKKGASIGSGSVILCDVTIGENAMIGAGSVVTRDVPANAVVVGNPARIIRYCETICAEVMSK